MSKCYLVRNAIIASSLITLSFCGIIYLAIILIKLININEWERIVLMMNRNIVRQLIIRVSITIGITVLSLMLGLEFICKVTDKGIEAERRKWLM